MRRTLALIVFSALSATAFAGSNTVTIRCGTDDDANVLEIVIDKGPDKKSDAPKILMINDREPCRIDGIESADFGEACYDNVELSLEKGLRKGTAVYKKYRWGFASTDRFELKCVSKK